MVWDDPTRQEQTANVLTSLITKEVFWPSNFSAGPVKQQLNITSKLQYHPLSDIKSKVPYTIKLYKISCTLSEIYH